MQNHAYGVILGKMVADAFFKTILLFFWAFMIKSRRGQTFFDSKTNQKS